MKKKYINLFKKICIGLLVVCLSLISIGYIAFYFFVKSDLNYYTDKITNYVSEEIKREVSIEKLEAEWVVTNPRFIINQFSIYNHDKSKAFNLKKIEIDLSWISLFKLDFVLDQIIIHTPTLEIQKNSSTEYLVGGINVDLQNEQSVISDWLLNQDDIIVSDGEITWIDNTRGKIPNLILSNLNFNYQTSTILSYLDRHFFTLNFYSSAGSSEKIIMNGHIDIGTINSSEELDGKISIKSKDISLNAFRQWVDYPVDIKKGKGSIEATGVITKGILTEATATLDIENFNFSSREKYDSRNIQLNNFSGDIIWSQSGNQTNIQLNEIDLVTTNGVNLKKANASVSFNSVNEELLESSLNVDRINLESMSELLSIILPNSEFTNQTLKSLSPKGELKELKFSWKRNNKNPVENLLIEAQLLKLKFNEYGNFPGLDNITGQLKFADNKGYFKSVSRDVSIKKYNTFRAPLTFSQMSGELYWKNNALTIKDFIIRDEHILSNIQGTVKSSLNNNLYLNLDIDIPKVDIPSLKRLYPKQLSKEALGWLDTSLLKGSAEDIKIKIGGKASDFPFVNEYQEPDLNKGIFTITGSIKDSFIEYGAEWPELEDFDTELSVSGSRFIMESSKGHIAENSIVNFKAAIHPFTSESIKMNIDAVFNSPTKNIIAAVNQSPLKDYTKGVFGEIEGSGDGELKLKMVVPFNDIDNIPFEGTYEFQGSSLENKRLNALNNNSSKKPNISNLKGLVYISNDDVSIENVEGVFYDEPLNISLKNVDEVSKFDIKGYIGEEFIKELLGNSFTNKIIGKAEWVGKINLYTNKSEFLVTSDLIGIKIKDLSILDKLEDNILPFSINKSSTNLTEDKILFQLGSDIKAIINITRNSRSSGVIKNGLITINSDQKSTLPDKGIHLIANILSANEKDFDFLLSTNKSEIKSDGGERHIAINQAEILIQDLNLYGYILANANIKMRPSIDGNNIQFKSDGANGNILWDKNNNLIKARFDKLHLLEETEGIEETEGKEEDRLIFYNPPRIDIKVQSFKSQTSNIGVLEGQMRLLAAKEKKIWEIELFDLMNKNNILKMSGSWDDEGLNPSSSVNFDWNLINLDKTLEQLEMSSLIKGGSAKIKGYLSWPGNPLSFDKSITDGRFSLDAKEGIILEVKPGVGRLFGLLTLQNLPRRLQLDFSDLFSEGFVFDEINSSVKISNGLLNSDNLEIDGPAADILIRGSIDLIEETQELFVKVTPRITDSMSLIALAGGPIAGAAAFIAQKILDDPLNEVLTDQYKIIGTWSDPIEEEVEQDNILGNIIDEQIINPTRELFE